MTIDIRELLLNAVALEFVINIDELVYAALAPGRLKQVLDKLQPLVVPSWRERCGLDLYSTTVSCLLVCTVLLFSTVQLDPLTDHLTKADDALCAGQLNFIYAPNGVGSVVWAPSTATSEDEVSVRAWPADEASATFAQNVISAVITRGPEVERSFNETTENACDESCSFANDGDCDDGGPGYDFAFCSEGTDCADCGNRTIRVRVPSAAASACFMGISSAAPATVDEPTGPQDSTCVAEQTQMASISSGRFSVVTASRETADDANRKWNPECLDLLGRVHIDVNTAPINATIGWTAITDEIGNADYVNLLRGAVGDAMRQRVESSGATTACGGPCPMSRPFCDERAKACIVPTCTDMAEFCYESSTMGVRARQLCPLTCECNSPASRLALTLPESGCPRSCTNIESYYEQLGAMPCIDSSELRSTGGGGGGGGGVGGGGGGGSDLGGGLNDRTFDRYLDALAGLTSEWPSTWATGLLDFLPSIREHGCSAIYNFRTDVIGGLDLCTAGATYWPIKPFSYMCPVSCGCRPGMQHCPLTCTGDEAPSYAFAEWNGTVYFDWSLTDTTERERIRLARADGRYLDPAGL